jgi:hypothetical protein
MRVQVGHILCSATPPQYCLREKSLAINVVLFARWHPPHLYLGYPYDVLTS